MGPRLGVFFGLLAILLALAALLLSFAGALGGPTGVGASPSSSSAAGAKYTCNGPQIQLFSNWNVGGVSNGGKAPSFSTGGKAYCLVSIADYHWNSGKGETPGQLGLSGSSSVGPLQAVGSSGQGAAPNVNWQTNLSTTSSSPVVLDGNYTCVDSSPSTWSEDTASGGKGYCKVVVTAAQGVPSGVTTAQYTCNGPQIQLFSNWNGGGVSNGGKAPSFSTGGKAYCLNGIADYHWNAGKGMAPGQLGLSGSSKAGPYNAVGSSGQSGAPNVNWQANVPSTPAPVIIDGTYTCEDSSLSTWSEDSASGGKGFCKVYVTAAEQVAGSSSHSAGTTPALASAPIVGLSMTGGCAGKGSAFDNTGTLLSAVSYPGSPPFSKSHPLVVTSDGTVQWAGSTPAPFTHHHWALYLDGVPVASGGAPNLQMQSAASGIAKVSTYVRVRFPGIFHLRGVITSSAGECGGDIWVKVLGSPTGTPPWGAGLGLAVLGLLGLTTSIPRLRTSGLKRHPLRGAVSGLGLGIGLLLLGIVYSIFAASGLYPLIVLVAATTLLGVLIGVLGPQLRRP